MPTSLPKEEYNAYMRNYDATRLSLFKISNKILLDQYLKEAEKINRITEDHAIQLENHVKEKFKYDLMIEDQQKQVNQLLQETKEQFKEEMLLEISNGLAQAIAETLEKILGEIEVTSKNKVKEYVT